MRGVWDCSIRDWSFLGADGAMGMCGCQVRNEESLVASICTGLGEMQQQLKDEMNDLMKAEMCCESALKMLQKEETALRNKLSAIRTKLKTTSSMRKEADMMLELHKTLGKSGSLSGTVRYIFDDGTPV